MEYKNKKTGAVISTASELAGAWIPIKKEDIEEAEKEQPKKKAKKKK